METKDILKGIDEEIRKASPSMEAARLREEIENAAPPMEPSHALQALNNTNIYLFRYFPKLKMIVLTERLCHDFNLQPVYHHMPQSFSSDFVSEKDQVAFRQMYDAIDEGVESASCDIMGKSKMTWCHVTLTTVERDEHHRPELCTGVVEDHTKEKLFQAELNSILSSISCGILQYRKSDNKLLRANKAAIEILGYRSFEELSVDREYGIVRSVLPEDRKYIKEVVDSLTDAGQVRAIEYRVKHKDSEQIRYCYGTVQIYDDIHGERIVQRTIMDITDRHINEEIQQTNNELLQRLDMITSGISGGFEITLDDENFTYVFVSENVAALQGYSVSELLEACNHNVLDNVYPDDRESVIKAMEHVTEKTGTYVMKYRVIHKNGSIIWVSDTGKKVIDKDGNRLNYCLIQDITESKKREEELSHLLTMQQQMVASLGCGVFAYTFPEREILIINQEAKRMFQYEDSNDKHFIEVIFDSINETDRGNIRDAIKYLNFVGDSCTYLLHPQLQGGHPLTIECRTRLLAFDDGKKFILSVLSDITELEEKNAELNRMNSNQKDMLSVLRRERKQYQDALVSDSEYSYHFDLTDGIIENGFDYSVRGGLEENLGIKAPVSFEKLVEQWKALHHPQFLTPEGQNPMTIDEIRACYERGMKHIVTEYFNIKESKYFRRTFLLSEDEETGHIMAIAIVNNITETVREETRRSSELAMVNYDLRKQISISKAFSSIYFASWDVNLESGRIRAITIPNWAKQMQELCGDSFDKMAGKMISSYVSEEYKDTVRQFINLNNMAERLREESILTCEYQGTHFGWSSICLIPFMRETDGSVTRVIIALREIGKEKRIELEAKQALEDAYEAANRANAAKTDFLSSVSHDIRTPMNGIIGMTAIAGTHLDDKERVADCLSKISISSKHLLGLINEVLDMNKIESGKLDLSVEEFSLSELLDTLLIMSKSQIEAKHHQLSVNLQDVSHEVVIGDSLRLQQVFMNLLSNAIKYTPAGGQIKLNLSEKNTNNPKIGCFEFTVEDNGIGMSEEFQKQLFEPFSRAKDSRVEKMQGSGLGMPIARNIVQMMNGDIKVESELGKGTKMTVTIYLELQETDEQFSSEEFIDLPILVADDDEVSCESTCAVLHELGMDGEWVLSGEEAVEKAVGRHERGDDYFAVILDWKMPGMDGVETAKALRRQIGKDVPIIILSAYDWSDIEQEARAAGVNAFLSKPVFKSRISYLFRSLLGNEPEHVNSSAIKDLSDEDFSGRRALLVEDNELNAEIATELIGITGMQIDHAVNGKEAIDFVTDHPDNYYDIIFMDIQMPVMNGYEATRAIRSLPGDYAKRVPIIAMTANAFAEDVQAAKNAGMNEHISKPLNIPQLTKSLEHWLTGEQG